MQYAASHTIEKVNRSLSQLSHRCFLPDANQQHHMQGNNHTHRVNHSQLFPQGHVSTSLLMYLRMSKVQHHFACCFHLSSFIGTFSSSFKQPYSTAKKIPFTSSPFSPYFSNHLDGLSISCYNRDTSRIITNPITPVRLPAAEAHQSGRLSDISSHDDLLKRQDNPVNSLILVMIFTSLVVEGCQFSGLCSSHCILTRIYH